MRAISLAVVLLFLGLHTCFGQAYAVEGKITDIQGNPLPFVPVYAKGTTNGSIANEHGVYQIKLDPGTYTIIFRVIGYEQQTREVTITTKNLNVDMKLEPESYTLESYLPQDTEVDSAEVIMQQVIAKRQYYLHQVKEYACQIYLKADQKLINAPNTFLKADVAKVLNLDAARRGIISLFESISQFYVRQPGKVKEIMLGLKAAGGENPFGFNRAKDLQINLYENLLSWDGLSNRPYISPIADRALKYYHYRLLQKFTDDNNTIDVLEVIPKHENEHVFHGVIYVIEKQWRLYSADLHLYKSSHIDFVDTLNIREQYIPVTDSVWMPLSLNFNFTGKILGFKYAGYFLGIANNYNIHPNLKPDYFTGEVFEVGKNINKKDSVFWANNRQVPLVEDEKRYYHLFEEVEQKQKEHHAQDSVKSANNKFRLVPYMLKNYVYHDPFKKITITVPTPTKLAFYNTVEGFSFDIKPQFLKEYDRSKSLTVEPELRYGTSDKDLTFNTNFNYRYNPSRQAAVYGSIGSDYLDLNNSGTLSLFLNSLSTLFTGNNYLKLYKSKFVSAGTQGEIMNGVLLNGQFEYAHRQTATNTSLVAFGKDSVQLTSNNPFDPTGNSALFPTYNAFSIRTSATITFYQQYTINPDGKFIEPTKYPRLRVNYRKGLPLLGSVVDYDFLSADFFQDQVKMGIYGFASYFVSVGKFFNAKSLYYPDYKQFSGGQSFFFNSSIGSFHFLDYYTYSTDKKYLEAHYEHNFAGFFLGRIPLVRNLNLEEIIGGSYLTQELLPGYKEFYVGLKRSVVRLDYGFAYGINIARLQGFRFTYNF
jgi:hypothetical protein